MLYKISFECDKIIRRKILKKIGKKRNVINLAKDTINQEFIDIKNNSVIEITIMNIMDDYILEILVNIDNIYYSMCFIELI